MKRLSSASSLFKRNIVTLVLIFSVLFVFIPSSMAAPDPPSIEWSKTYQGLQANAVIQTSDGGYAIAGKAWSSEAATLIKTDSSGNVQWQKAIGDVVSLAQTSDSGFVLFRENGDVVKTDAEGNVLSSFSVGVAGFQQGMFIVTVLGSSIGVQEGIVTSDGTYIIIGNSIDNGEIYAWLRKVDEIGRASCRERV